jgi:hypothetical protein
MILFIFLKLLILPRRRRVIAWPLASRTPVRRRIRAQARGHLRRDAWPGSERVPPGESRHARTAPVAMRRKTC